MAGEENGIRGYFLTFMIAYIRDFVTKFSFIAESMETSCPWSKVSTLCAKTNEKILKTCIEKGLK